MADYKKDMLAESSDYAAMKPQWLAVQDILGGVEAMRARGKEYLPQFPNESDANYAYRSNNSKFTNIFWDISSDLAARPFTKEVTLPDSPAAFDPLVEDIDRCGNHLHMFARDTFAAAVNNGIDWILVDHTKVPAGATLADERKAKARPYWVHVPALALKAVYSAIVDGAEEIVYARIDESGTDVYDGLEVQVCKVRVLIRDRIALDDGTEFYAPARFEVWENRSKDGWVQIDQGPITIGVIPMVPVVLGARMLGKWRVRLPLKAVLDLQIKHYQQETNLENAKELTAFPMFTGNGISPPIGTDGLPAPMPLGPSTVLYAPMNDQGNHGQWGVLEISAESLTFLANEIDKTEKQMRELGRQPLTEGTAGITQTVAAMSSQKASTAIIAWAYTLKDALERAMALTALWLKTDAPDVYVNTDLAVSTGNDGSLEILLKSKQDGSISRSQYLTELKRRSVLSPDFDEDADAAKLLEEVPADTTQDDNAALGNVA